MDIIIKIGFYFFVVFILSLGLSKYIVALFKEKKTFLQTIMSPFSKFLSWAFHWDLEKPMKAKEYFLSLLGISFLSFLFVFLLLLIQPYLPEHKPSMDIRNAFHTAISFLTNTNFQNYIPEQEVSNLVQMIGLTVQNFLSAGIGIAVLFALMRGFLQKEKENLGNCWKDLSKIILELLLPLSVIFSIILVSCGVVQTFKEKKEIRTLEGEQQEIDIGTVASQVAIKQLGSNGGGYFSSNAAHPFENPTEISNFVEMVGILLIPMSLVLAFGKIIGERKQGYILFKVMLFLLIIGVTLGVSIETQYQNWEGKETRFGIANSSLWSILTTATSNGSTNSALNDYHPYSIFLFMLQMGMGEVIFGGVGVGLYTMLAFVLLTVFIAGLMIGKSPQYLGKKIEKEEMKMTLWIILATPISVLMGTLIATIISSNSYSFSQIFYGFLSSGANNGSSLGGFLAGDFSVLLGFVMLFARYIPIYATLHLAENMAKKKVNPENIGTLKTTTPVFGVLLVVVIIVIGALGFLPSLVLGPIAEIV